jgi:flagellar basal body rod protein FlgG
MFIDRLFKQDSTPVLEQLLQFTTARSQVLAEDVVNIDTPGYKSKDLNLAAFQKLLAERIDNSRSQPPGSTAICNLIYNPPPVEFSSTTAATNRWNSSKATRRKMP